ncbi:helix-turn-helix transcriptional regulator [Variovorax sp. YR752]|uniref:helix-turn-helix domain-containing protein n=1 Tax=Variovorax sp. YR752 TaxID=1884383 RepID=UPI003137C245
MQKTTSSMHNTIFLSLLRDCRESMRLRQADLAMRLGRGQATVSKVERGERRLDVIELRAWLGALEVDFLTFMSELDKRLRPLPVVDPIFLAKRSRRRQS